jgi:hypothetical protein
MTVYGDPKKSATKTKLSATGERMNVIIKIDTMFAKLKLIAPTIA